MYAMHSAFNIPVARAFGAIIAIALLATLSSCGGGHLELLGGSGSSGGVIPAFTLPTSVAIADVNGDGVPDLAVAASTVAGAPPHPGFISVLVQIPGTPGTFRAPTRYPAGNDPNGLALGDLVGDGRQLDAVVANTQLAFGDLKSNVISVLRRDPAKPGAFLPPESLSVGVRNPNAIAIGDVDGDGRPDIVVASDTVVGLPAVLIYLQDSQGHFVTTTSLTLPGGAGASGVTVGDLNRDGHLDIVVTTNDSVVGFLQDAAHSGQFLPGVSYGAGFQPLGVRIADLNGDGLPDLVVSNRGTPTGSNPTVSVLLQNLGTPGGFLPATNYSTGLRSQGVAIADLNGDGRPDIAVANTGSFNSGSSGNTGSVSVLLQTSNAGIFSGAVNYGDLSISSELAVGDLNQDGRANIAVVDNFGVSILFQDPHSPVRFLAPVRFGI